MFVYKLSGCGFKSCWSHLNFRYRACFKEEVPGLQELEMLVHLFFVHLITCLRTRSSTSHFVSVNCVWKQWTCSIFPSVCWFKAARLLANILIGTSRRVIYEGEQLLIHLVRPTTKEKITQYVVNTHETALV